MSRLTMLVVFVLALVLTPRALAGPYDDLLKHASANTNALVLIDVKRGAASPLAKKEKWAERIQQSGHGGLAFFPTDAELVAVTGEINLTTMVRDFQIGLVKLRNLPNFNRLASQEGGSVDQIAGQLTVVSPRSVYFTSFSGGVLAAAYPADRQYVARWLRASKANKLPELAPHLRTVADNSGDNTVTIALDLEDVVDPSALRLGLQFSPVMVKNPNVNQSALATFIARAKGMTFEAKVTDRVDATITVVFSDEAARYRAVLKDLFLELIDGYGVSIAGLDSWEAKFIDKSMTLSGPMSCDDLRRVVSLFSFPRADLEEQDPMAPMDGPTVGATRRYMTAMNTILNDIKFVRDSNNYGRTATWHEKSASQLEQLSRRNVDPLAVDAAFQAGQHLRAIASSLRGVPIDTAAIGQKAYSYTQIQPNMWGPYGGAWWGGFRQLAFAPRELRTNIPQVQGEMARVVADDQKRRIATWNQIDQLMVDTRRKLTDKYKTNF